MSIAAVLRCGGGKFSRLLIFAAGKSAALSAAFISRHRGALWSPWARFPGDMAHPCASARQAKQAAHCGRVAVDGGGGLRVKRNTADAPTLGGGVRGKTESLNGAGLRRRIGRQITKIGRQITKIGRQITNGAPSRRLTGITSHAYPFPRAVRAAASRGRPRCAPVLVPSVS